MVDPLDGTKEFIKRNGEFTVNIALIENNQPTLGVIYAPALNLVYYGEKTQGSFKIDGKGNKISLKRTVPSGGTKTLRIVGSRSHSNVKFEKYIQELEKKYEAIMVKSIGSSLKFCLVAENQADHYPRLAPTMEWDTAAGHAIAKLSGYEILSLNTNKEILYNKELLLNDEFVVL
jgi:3'(2'), 5'-bisphosphate nucleotidase